MTSENSTESFQTAVTDDFFTTTSGLTTTGASFFGSNEFYIIIAVSVASFILILAIVVPVCVVWRRRKRRSLKSEKREQLPTMDDLNRLNSYKERPANGRTSDTVSAHSTDRIKTELEGPSTDSPHGYRTGRNAISEAPNPRGGNHYDQNTHINDMYHSDHSRAHTPLPAPPNHYDRDPKYISMDSAQGGQPRNFRPGNNPSNDMGSKPGYRHTEIHSRPAMKLPVGEEPFQRGPSKTAKPNAKPKPNSSKLDAGPFNVQVKIDQPEETGKNEMKHNYQNVESEELQELRRKKLSKQKSASSGHIADTTPPDDSMTTPTSPDSYDVFTGPKLTLPQMQLNRGGTLPPAPSAHGHLTNNKGYVNVPEGNTSKRPVNYSKSTDAIDFRSTMVPSPPNTGHHTGHLQPPPSTPRGASGSRSPTQGRGRNYEVVDGKSLERSPKYLREDRV